MTIVTALGTDTAIITNSTLPVTPSSQNPCLILPYNSIKSSDWNTPTTTDLDPWILCFIRKLFDYNANAQNEQHAVTVVNKFISTATRNNVANRKVETYTVNAYGASVGSFVDPDDLISA